VTPVDDLHRAEQADPCMALAHLVRGDLSAVHGILRECRKSYDLALHRVQGTMDGLQGLLDSARAKSCLTLIDPAGSYQIRSDGSGDGAFGASRRSGDRRYTHTGLDTMVVPGMSVRAPLTGRVVRLGRCYAGDSYRLVVIEAGPWECRVLYALCPDELVGKPVQMGEHIGIAQDVTARNDYRTQGMLPHLHTEVRHAGELVDPTPFMFGG